MKRWWVVPVLASLLLAAPSQAWAGEDEWQLGLDLFGSVTTLGGAQGGAGAGIHASYGFAPAWSVVLSTRYRLVAPKTTATGVRLPARHLTGITAGVYFAIDVMRLVPFLHAGLGAYMVYDDVEGVRFSPGAEAGLSFDYALSRRINLGVDVIRVHLLRTDGVFWTPMDFGVRLTYVWF